MSRFSAPCILGGFLAALLASSAQAAINVSTDPTQNMSCSGGVCTATAQKAYLNVNDVTNMLAAGDLKIATAAGAQDIHIQAPFSWTSTRRLTLDAQRSIEFQKPVTVAGTGALTLITNDGGTGGDYWFDPGASVSFWDTSSSLIINGQSFTLVKDIKTLASVITKNSKGNYALASSYDASADGAYKHAVVTATLTGAFDGLGNAISNFWIRKDNRAKDLNIGLFAQLGTGGAIRNAVLTNPYITADADNENVGALVAYSHGGSIAHSTITSGSVSGGYNAQSNVVGGLVGRSDASSVVISSGSAASAYGGYGARVGGLVGYNSGTISGSFATGSAGAQIEAYTGGLVGLSDGSIDSSFATGAISAGGILWAARPGAEVSSERDMQQTPMPRGKFRGVTIPLSVGWLEKAALQTVTQQERSLAAFRPHSVGWSLWRMPGSPLPLRQGTFKARIARRREALSATKRVPAQSKTLTLPFCSAQMWRLRPTVTI